ncbi:MAG: hypothetical protein ACOYEC_02740 [Christensenellales bacterium]|jgi:hypothetical protein|nr:hypothetical protein [Clostridiales bacterium]
MFNKLYSDKTTNKLQKIPVWAWMIFYGIASVFTSLYDLVNLRSDLVDFFNEFAPHLNSLRMLSLAYPLSVLIDIAVFELVAYLVYQLLAGRFFMDINQRNFIFRLRVTMIMANAAIGIVSLLYFALPQARLIMSSVVNPLARSFLLIMFMYEVSKQKIRPGIAHKAYLFATKYYLLFNIVINAIGLISLYLYEDVQISQYIAYACTIAVYALMGILVWKQYDILKKLPPEEQPPQKDQPQQDDIIFKDFGF